MRHTLCAEYSDLKAYMFSVRPTPENCLAVRPYSLLAKEQTGQNASNRDIDRQTVLSSTESSDHVASVTHTDLWH